VSPVPRVLVVDNHAIFRKRVVDVVAESISGACVDEAVDRREALAKVKQARYKLVLLDISTQAREGLEVLGEIRSQHPKLPVLILSMQPEEEYAALAFRAGASGFVRKVRAAEELAGAIRKVMAGGRFMSASLEGDGERKMRVADDDR
jgi:two-component system invasion response regulator UvrY